MSTCEAMGARRFARRSGLGFLGVLCASGVFALTAGAGSALASATFTEASGWNVSSNANAFQHCTGSCQFGSADVGAGGMSQPADVAYGSSTADVYVADPGNNRVDVFSTGGNFVMAIGGGVNSSNSTNAKTGTYNYCTSQATCQAGNPLTDAINGDLENPSGVAVSGSDLFVADTGNDRVVEFSVSGATATFLGDFGTSGSASGDMTAPMGLAVNGSDIYIADSGNNRVDEWSFNSTPTFTLVRNFGATGTAAGDMEDPEGIAVSGNVYVADTGNDRIDVFSSTGTLQEAFGGGVRPGSPTLETCTTSTTCQAGNGLSEAGDIDKPTGVAVDINGFIYVADNGNERIDDFSSPGNLSQAWGWNVASTPVTPRFQTCSTNCQAGVSGGGAGEFNLDTGSPPLLGGVVVDNNGDVFVGDTNSNRLDEFSIETFDVTSTALVSSVNPSTTGESVTFTATVSPNPGGGDIGFTDDGSTISNCATVALNSVGQATCTVTFSTVSQQTIQATFGGNSCFETLSCSGSDIDYESSTSNALVQNVQAPPPPPPPPPAATVTQLLASSPSIVTGQSLVLSAEVSPSPNGGTVEFLDGGTAIVGCTAVTVSAGKAVCDLAFPAPGQQEFTAIYSGDGQFVSSDSTEVPVSVVAGLTLHGRLRQSGDKIELTLACSPAASGGCLGTMSGTTRAAGKTVSLGSKRATIAAGATKMFVLTLSKANQKLLAKHKTLKATVTIVQTVGTTATKISTGSLTLKAPKTKKKKKK